MSRWENAAKIVLVLLAVGVLLASAWRVDREALGRARLEFEREAVEHNAATWTVNDDGERVFTWNESEAEGE